MSLRVTVLSNPRAASLGYARTVASRVPRALCYGACLLFAAVYPARPRAQAPSPCMVAGAIASGRIPLPGVVVSLADADAHAGDTTASGADGLYSLKAPGPGRYTLKAE